MRKLIHRRVRLIKEMKAVRSLGETYPRSSAMGVERRDI
jgi:hypothetical protein